MQVEEPGKRTEAYPVDTRAYYVFGREAGDIVLDHPSASRSHAALVHHQDGRVYIIDLQSVGGAVCVYVFVMGL